MARVLGPDPGNRTVLRASRTLIARTAAGAEVRITTDEAGLTPANILAYQSGAPGTPGAAISGSLLRLDALSRVPPFWYPDGVGLVYAHLGRTTVALPAPGATTADLQAGDAAVLFTASQAYDAATVGVTKNGLTAIRFVGYKSTAGAPTTGTWAAGDLVMDSAKVLWRCTAAGTPGTWA